MQPHSTRLKLNDDPTTASAETRRHRLRLGVAIGWTLLVMLLCWLPREVVHRVENSSSWFEINYLDKVVHCAIFVVVTVLWVRALPPSGRIVRVGLVGLALAFVTELVQLLPAIGRDATLGDAITDLVGIAVGFALAPRLEPIFRAIEDRVLGPRAA